MALLGEWRSRLPPDGGAQRANDPLRYERWADLEAEVVEHFDGRSSGALTDLDRHRLLRWINGEAVDDIHAVAWGLDVVGVRSFPPSWADSLGARNGSYLLRPGDPYPVLDAAAELYRGQTLSSRPAALTPPRLGELPHIRFWEAGEFEVTVDFSHAGDLEKIGRSLSLAAAAHPNQDKSEIDFNNASPGMVFPIVPKDPREQLRRVMRLVERALELGAQIIVIPELAGSPAIAQAIAEVLDDLPSQRLVVAGSYHDGSGPTAANLAVALTPEAEPLYHAKTVAFSDELGHERPWKEGIATHLPRRLTIYEADRFRFCFAICKDFLDGGFITAASRLGVTILCVPAMSEKTASFRSRAAQLVADAQTTTVCANGPLTWDGLDVWPCALLGRPVAGAEIVESPAGQPLSAPGLTLFGLTEPKAQVESGV